MPLRSSLRPPKASYGYCFLEHLRTLKANIMSCQLKLGNVSRSSIFFRDSNNGLIVFAGINVPNLRRCALKHVIRKAFVLTTPSQSLVY